MFLWWGERLGAGIRLYRLVTAPAAEVCLPPPPQNDRFLLKRHGIGSGAAAVLTYSGRCELCEALVRRLPGVLRVPRDERSGILPGTASFSYWVTLKVRAVCVPLILGILPFLI